ncbi:MAG: GNAT family N-acetyltransferase [Salinivirgaceae bacterium]|jgi:diamine N-acetyltransferase
MGSLLQNEVVILRGLEPEDLEFLYQCENNPQIWTVSNTLVPYTRYVLKQYIADSQLDIYTTKQLRLIIASAEKPEIPVGAIDLFDFDPYHQRAGVGILIHQESDRGKGFAFYALTLLMEYCFQHLHLHQLYCNITADNSKSIALFEKAGFKKCGIKKDWIKTANGWLDERMFQAVKPIDIPHAPFK